MVFVTDEYQIRENQSENKKMILERNHFYEIYALRVSATILVNEKELVPFSVLLDVTTLWVTLMLNSTP